MDEALAAAALLDHLPTRQVAAAVLAAVVVGAAVTAARAGGGALRRHWPALAALLVGLAWVAAIGRVPWTADGWVLVALALMLLLLAGRSEAPAAEPPPAALAGAAWAATTVAVVLVGLRVHGLAGGLLTWEPEVLEGLVDEVGGRRLGVGTLSLAALRWGHGLVGSSWDSLLWGPPTALALALLGASAPVLRLVSAGWALVWLLLLWRLGRRAGGAAVGRLVVIVGALQPPLVFYGGYGVVLSATVAAVLAAGVAVVAMVEAPHPRWWHGLLAGLALAAATLGYAPGRVAALGLAACALALTVRRRRRGDRRGGAALAVLLVCLATVAAAEVAAGSGGRFLAVRGEQVFTLSDDQRQRVAGDLDSSAGGLRLAGRMVERTWPEAASVLGRTFSPELSAEFAVRRDPPWLPYLFAPLFPFVAWGMTVSLRRPLDASHAVLLTVLAASTLPVLLSTRADAHRMVLATIPIAVWAGLGLAEAAAVVRCCGVRPAVIGLAGGLVAALGAGFLAGAMLPPPKPAPHVLDELLVEAFQRETGPVTVAIRDAGGAIGRLRLADLDGQRRGTAPRLRVVRRSLVDAMTAATPDPKALRETIGRIGRNGVLLLAPADRWRDTVERLAGDGWVVASEGDGSSGLWVVRRGRP